MGSRSEAAPRTCAELVPTMGTAHCTMNQIKGYAANLDVRTRTESKCSLFQFAGAKIITGIAAALSATASIKFLSAVMETPLLRTRDPVFTFLTVRQVTLIAAVAEVFVAVHLFRWKCNRSSA